MGDAGQRERTYGEIQTRLWTAGAAIKEVHMRLAAVLAIAAVAAVIPGGAAQAGGTGYGLRAKCVETTNPHGQNIPPAGYTTAPGTNPNSGQNDDGFYLLTTNTGAGNVFVLDNGSGHVFGPFPAGTKIKYTQNPGGKVEQQNIGSTNGQAGAVLWHLKGKGDAFVFSTDNVKVPCRVSPPPR
jgi:hypothetical protein